MIKENKNIPTLRFPEFKGEWIEKKLGEVAKFSKGKGISKADISEEGETECIRYGQLYTDYNEIISKVISKTNIEKKDLVLSEANDVIIPASGETQIDISTASCVLNSGIALGGDLNIIKTKHNGVFLSYYLNYRKKIDIANLAQGISVVHLYSSQLALLSLNIPTLPEQQKIASFLSIVDKRLEQLNKKKKLLEQYKKGVMQKIFNQEIRFKARNGKDFPDWEEKKLGEVGEIITGKTPSTTNENYWNGKIQFITPTDINDSNKYQTITERTVNNNLQNNNNKILSKGSIVYTCIASIGKMSITVKPSITNQQINSIIVYDDFYNEFIYYSLLYITPFIKSTQANTTLPIINKTEFSKFKIKIPKIKEQQKIAHFLSSIDSKIDLVTKQIENSSKWKKGLLQQLFI